MTSWLDEIMAPSAGDLTLGTAQLGGRLFATLQGLRIIDKALVIGNPKVAPRHQDWLDISGVARGRLARSEVTLHLRLFEGSTGERECLMRLEAPGSLDKLVTDWLSSFDTDPWEVLTALEGVKWCVLASSDVKAEAEKRAVPLPDGWPKDDLPLERLTAGVTCFAETVEYDGDFVSELETKIGTPSGALLAPLGRGPAWIRLAPPEPVTKPRRDAVHMLRLRSARGDGTVLLPGFAAEFRGAEVLLPMSLPGDDDGPVGPRVCLPGKLAIRAAKDQQTFEKAQQTFEVEAGFDLLSETVTARFRKPPKLQALPGLDKGGLAADAPPWFDELLERATAEAWIVLDWSSDTEDGPAGKTVLAIGGAVGADAGALIELFPPPRRLTLAPSVTLEVEHPFTEGQRRLSGRMEGSLTLWEQEGVAATLTGSVEIPGWYFTATAEPREVGALVGALGLDEIALPDPLLKERVSLSLSGDVATKSFSAALEFGNQAQWCGEANGKTWALSGLVIGVGYDGDAKEFDFGVTATLAFQTFYFEVSGGYEGGWFLRGRMKEDGTLDVSAAIGGLLQGLPTLPPGIATEPGKLVLRDVAFAADFSAGAFSVGGRTAQQWCVLKDVYLNVEALEFERSEGGTSATLAVRLTLGDVDMLLEASTQGGTDAGWLFKGSSRPGQKIKIATLVGALCKKLGSKDALPPALADFAFEAISVSYNTKEEKEFAFGCTGDLKIEGKDVRATVTVSFTAGAVEGSKLRFAADVQIGGLNFGGAVLADQGAKTTTIVATFRSQDKQGVSLTAILEDMLRGGSFPALDVGLKEALFVYRKEATRTGLLFGVKLDLDAAINLDALPALKALVGGQRIGAENLGLLLATADLSADGVNAINAELKASSLALPPVKGEGKDARLGRGAHVTGTLKLGPQAPVPLVLPMGGEAPAPVRAGPVEAPKPAEPEGAKWLEIGKSLGPLHIGRVGLQYAAAEKRLGFLLDSAVDLAGLHVALTGFALRVSLEREPADKKPRVTLGLDGLDLAYDGGAVAVQGAFLRRKGPGDIDSYDGLALIKAPTFGITAFGSFTTVDGAASMFIFGALHGELGGPPAFRVQGIAAGFGYNRRLTLPPIEQVHEFPLVRAAMDAAFIQADKPDKAVGTVMAQLATYVAPSLGDYWLAAGIKFNSFEMVTAVTILSVSFGNDVEIGILGLAKMSLPRGAKTNEIAHAELALRASIRPRDGTVIVEGRLTDASFILSKDCRLTGGFAFCAWFSGRHAGDFVVTLGGYHPAFVRPEHYPVVPRLGIHWQVTPELTIAAELYFALTPSCIMTGGRMAAVYTSRNVRAWFVIHVDFLVRWEPLHYEATAGIRIGLVVDLGCVSLLVDLQVALRIWGPPFSGELEADLGVISVAIAFGDQYRKPAKLDAEAFRRAFLPADGAVLAARVERGLLRREAADGKDAIHVVNAHEMALSVESVVPLTAFGDAAEPLKSNDTALGVGPMALKALDSRMSVKFERTVAPGRDEPVELTNLRLDRVDTGVPAALWTPAEKDGVLPPPPVKVDDKRRAIVGPRVTSEPRADGTRRATVGLRIALEPRPPAGSLPWMSLETLGRSDVPKAVPLAAVLPPPVAAPPSTIADAMSAGTTGRRNAVLGVLAAQHWPFALEKVDLTATAGQARSCFQQDPDVCALGSRDERRRVV